YIRRRSLARSISSIVLSPSGRTFLGRRSPAAVGTYPPPRARNGARFEGGPDGAIDLRAHSDALNGAAHGPRKEEQTMGRGTGSGLIGLGGVPAAARTRER